MGLGHGRRQVEEASAHRGFIRALLLAVARRAALAVVLGLEEAPEHGGYVDEGE